MMKKMKALLLACTVLTASLCTSVSGSAADRLVLTRDDSGDVSITVETEPSDDNGDTEYYTTTYSVDAYGNVFSKRVLPLGDRYAVTDGSDFPEEFGVLSDPNAWILWEEKEPAALYEGDPSWGYDIYGYKDGYENWMETYGSGARLFEITYGNINQTDRKSRELDLYYDNILDVVKFTSEHTEQLYWKGGFDMYIIGSKSPDELSDSKYDELAAEFMEAYGELREEFYTWEEAYNNWIAGIDAAGMTPAELAQSRREAGIATDCEMLKKARDLAQTFIQEHSDVTLKILPCIGYRQNYLVYYPETIWETVGDLDEDGELTSADAAELLAEVAELGAGGFPTKVPGQDADINADFEYNAADAAYLLQYIAERGAGSELTLQEFLKQALK